MRWTGGRAGLKDRLGDFFDVDEAWQRPAPGPAGMRSDALIAAFFLAFAVLGLELTRSMGVLDGLERPPWQQYVAIFVGTVPLAWRRRYPIAVLVLLQLHMFVAGIWVVSVMGQFPMQIMYFFALCSGVAWARDRLFLAYAVLGVLTLMFGWLAWGFAFGNAVDSMLGHRGDIVPQGMLGPTAATVLYAFVINICYFGGALLWGRALWRGAWRLFTIEAQAATIEAQSDDLRDQAVVDERLRIARELHDVVAHHISVMGVQAAGARRVLTRDPERAADALSRVEESSRCAVGEMRALLGTLRDRGALGPGREAGGHSVRAPEPGLADIAELAAGVTGPGFTVTYDLVTSGPGALAAVPAPLGLSAYRIVQEALVNVRRHSTAAHAHAVTRIQEGPDGFVEVEVVDDGRPIGATSGTGLGMLGIRERAASHGGQVEVGPRLLGGYRVRVRFGLHRPAGATRTLVGATERRGA